MTFPIIYTIKIIYFPTLSGHFEPIKIHHSDRYRSNHFTLNKRTWAHLNCILFSLLQSIYTRTSRSPWNISRPWSFIIESNFCGWICTHFHHCFHRFFNTGRQQKINWKRFFVHRIGLSCLLISWGKCIENNQIIHDEWIVEYFCNFIMDFEWKMSKFYRSKTVHNAKEANYGGTFAKWVYLSPHFWWMSTMYPQLLTIQWPNNDPSWDFIFPFLLVLWLLVQLRSMVRTRIC